MRNCVIQRCTWGSLTLFSLLVFFSPLPRAVSGAEPEGLYLLMRDPVSDQLVDRQGVVLRYWDDTRLLVDVDEDAVGELAAMEVSHELVSPGSSGRSFYILFSDPEMAGREMISALPEVLAARGLWLVPASSGVDETLVATGLEFSILPRGPLPLRPKGPVALDPALTDRTRDDFLPQLSESTLYAYTQRLEDFVTRYTHGDSIYSAAAWIAERFSEFGYTEVVFDTFYVAALPDPRLCINVIATKSGEVYPERELLIGGHYDSTVLPGRPLIYAPGADDNASGVAAVLELARVFRPVSLDYTVKFIAFAAEEQGMDGSWHYVEDAYTRGDDIRLMLNMDMIGYVGDEVWDVGVLTDTHSEPYAGIMADLAEQYTPLIPVIGGAPTSSDHWPFMQYGYPALYAREGDFHMNTCWHRTCDTTERITFAYMLEVTRMVGATALSVAGTSGSAAVAAEEPYGAPTEDISIDVSPLPGSGPFEFRLRGLSAESWKLEVFDVRGRRVFLQEDAPVSGDRVSLRWNGDDYRGRSLPAGMYWARVSSRSASAVRPLVILR